MKFFFDNNLSPKYPVMLRALEVDVVHLREKFDRRVDDDVWMRQVASEGLVAVTQDRAIERRPHEAEVRRRVGLRMIYLPAAFMKMGLWEQAHFLVKMWPVIATAAEGMRPGLGLLLQQRGRFRNV